MINEESVSAEMALTNASGFDCDDITFNELEPRDKNISFVAYLNGEQHSDKVYCGTKIMVSGEIEIGKYRNISDDYSKMRLIAHLEDSREIQVYLFVLSQGRHGVARELFLVFR